MGRWYDNEDAGDARAYEAAEAWAYLDEQEEEALEEEVDDPCYACRAANVATSYMEQGLCWPCYEALANGRHKPDRLEFADPGGRSALRAAGPGNPRVHPCPTCRQPNRLTPQDRARGYQCDACADRAERGGDY